MALPMKAAPKNTLKGIRKWPQRNPARSNKGFGIYDELAERSLLKLAGGCI